MRSRRSHLTYAFVTFAMGAVLVLAGPAGALANDPIDPATQPHLKSWSNIIPNTDRRFVVLPDFNNAAVLDRETGLVWEKSPAGDVVDWFSSRSTCANKNIGGRKGWRLPSIAELASLIDPSVAQPGPILPTGHPFTNIQSANYWSATTTAGGFACCTFVDPGSAWIVHFVNGDVGINGKAAVQGYAWCARGPMNADEY